MSPPPLPNRPPAALRPGHAVVIAVVVSAPHSGTALRRTTLPAPVSGAPSRWHWCPLTLPAKGVACKLFGREPHQRGAQDKARTGKVPQTMPMTRHEHIGRGVSNEPANVPRHHTSLLFSLSEGHGMHCVHNKHRGQAFRRGACCR